MHARTTGGEKERKKKKKRVTPVRWSGLISEISSAKKFRKVRSLLSLHASVFLCFPPFPLPSPFPSLHRPRGNLRALLTSAIIVLAVASHSFIFIFTFEIPRSIIAARNYRSATRRWLFSLLLHPSPCSLAAVCFPLEHRLTVRPSLPLFVSPPFFI